MGIRARRAFRFQPKSAPERNRRSPCIPIPATLRDSIDDGAKLSIIASYFTVFAFGELKDELSKVAELRFVFDEPTFVKQMESEKAPREFVVRRRSHEKTALAESSRRRCELKKAERVRDGIASEIKELCHG